MTSLSSAEVEGVEGSGGKIAIKASKANSLLRVAMYTTNTMRRSLRNHRAPTIATNQTARELGAVFWST